MTNELTPSRYKEILADVIRIFKTVQNSLVAAYWETGRYVVEIELGGEARARYGARTLPNFSAELTESLGPGFSVPSLQRMRQFYQENPKCSPANKLPWAHHIELIPVVDAKVRRALETRALREGLTAKQVRALVRHESVRAQVAAQLKARDTTQGPGDTKDSASGEASRGSWSVDRGPELLKVPKLGVFGACQLKDPNETAWPDKNVLLLDHGFKAYRALTPAEARGLKAGDIVEWTGTKLKKTSYGVRGTGNDVLYTYRAYLESVVDGDTLWVMLATGMRGASRQKLRLRGIDCPEIDTEEGKKAKQFVISALGLQASAEGTAANKAGVGKVLKDVPSLIVLSSKNPTYDRYEADVFYPDPQKAGRSNPPSSVADIDRSQSEVGSPQSDLIYLNNLLLEEGYAVRVRD